jgi:hypothetical protein
LPRAAWAQEERIFPPLDKGASGEVEYEAPIHLGIEVEIEVVERSVSVAEAGLFTAPLQQSVAAAREFVGDQRREQIDGSHRFRLRLSQAGFQHRCHSSQPELA